MKDLINKGLEIYKNYREGILYLICGAFATIINIAVFGILTYGFNIIYDISNIIANIAAILFQYVSNKFIVFNSKKNNLKENIKEFFAFISCRLITMLMDQGLMKLGIEVFKINEMVTKVAVNVIVIIANYIFSKLIVFKKKK